ncbi:hypothetical protein ES703_34949 [subsurface metagenome]
MSITVLCHDGTPFCDYRCYACGNIMHVHRSQLPDGWPESELTTTCHRCGASLILPMIAWTPPLPPRPVDTLPQSP